MPVTMQVVSGRISGTWKAISTSRVSPYFNGLAHRARQSGAGGAILLIVFSANLSGITWLIPMETDEKTGFNKDSREGEINSVFDNRPDYFQGRSIVVAIQEYRVHGKGNF